MKMKKIAILAITFFILQGFYSCTQEEPFYFKLYFIVTDKITSNSANKYPEHFVELCKPFKVANENYFFSPYPINIIRFHHEQSNIEKELSVLNNKATNLKSHENYVDIFFTRGEGKVVEKDFAKKSSKSIDQFSLLNKKLPNYMGMKTKLLTNQLLK